jgi:hypothetical protein
LREHLCSLTFAKTTLPKNPQQPITLLHKTHNPQQTATKYTKQQQTATKKTQITKQTNTKKPKN